MRDILAFLRKDFFDIAIFPKPAQIIRDDMTCSATGARDNHDSLFICILGKRLDCASVAFLARENHMKAGLGRM